MADEDPLFESVTTDVRAGEHYGEAACIRRPHLDVGTIACDRDCDCATARTDICDTRVAADKAPAGFRDELLACRAWRHHLPGRAEQTETVEGHLAQVGSVPRGRSFRTSEVRRGPLRSMWSRPHASPNRRAAALQGARPGTRASRRAPGRSSEPLAPPAWSPCLEP